MNELLLSETDLDSLVRLSKENYKEFKKSFVSYKANIPVQVLEEIIWNLNSLKDDAVLFAEILIEQHMAELSPEFLVKFAVAQFDKENKNITLLEKLVRKISENKNNIEVAKLYFLLAQYTETFDKNLHLLLDDKPLDEVLFEYMASKSLFNDEEIVLKISLRVQNYVEFLAKSVVDKRIGKENLHYLLRTRDDITKVFARSLSLATNEPQTIPVIFSDIAKIFYKRFSSNINKAIFSEILQNAATIYNNKIISYVAKSLHDLYEEYLGSILATCLKEEDTNFFTTAGYYMAKYLETDLNLNWPLVNPYYGSFGRCDFPTYLVIKHALEQNDIPAADNIFKAFNLDILWGFIWHSIRDGLEAEQTNYILYSMKQIKGEAVEKFIAVLKDDEIKDTKYDDVKVKLLSLLLKSKELNNEIKKNIIKAGFIEEKLTKIFLRVISEANLYESSFVVEALSEALLSESKQIVWDNVIQNSDESFHPLIAKILCKSFFDTKKYDSLKDLSPKLFAHCLHYANDSQCPILLQKYSENKEIFEANIGDIANILIALNSHNALKQVLYYEKDSFAKRMMYKIIPSSWIGEAKKPKTLEINLSTQRNFLMKAITANDLVTLDIVSAFLSYKHKNKTFKSIFAETYHYITTKLNIFASLYNSAHNVLNYILQVEQSKEAEIGKSLFKLCNNLERNQVVLRELFLPSDQNAEGITKIKDFDDVTIMGITAYVIKSGMEKSNNIATEIFTKAFAAFASTSNSLEIKENFKKIGYSNLNKLLGRGQELDSNFVRCASNFLKDEYENMSWVERILNAEPKMFQLASKGGII